MQQEVESSINTGSSNLDVIETLVHSFLGSSSYTQHSLLRESEPSFCNSKKYVLYRVMEFCFKIIPSILFFVLGGIRYSKIRDIGQGRVVYSLHFKFKFLISALISLSFFLWLIITWA